MSLSELLGESVPPPPPPPARFWTEDQIIRFRDRDYRIVARLGSGGVGTTFKVVEIDRSTREDLGTYVAKVGHNDEVGRRVLRSYSLARSHLGRHPALSAIFEVAREWQDNNFIALLTWIEGAPLREFIGVFTLLAEEQQETSGGALALRWLRLICEALDVLHRNGLVHGDISPRNLIVCDSTSKELPKRSRVLSFCLAKIQVFWQLYWGRLSMVEKGEVEGAMVRFGDDLNAKAQLPVLQQDALQIAYACRDELARSWKIHDWLKEDHAPKSKP
jgi:serine/threonine protein kinase